MMVDSINIYRVDNEVRMEVWSGNESKLHTYPISKDALNWVAARCLKDLDFMRGLELREYKSK